MRRLLIITGLLLSLIALVAVASFADKPMTQEKEMCMVMSGNPAEIAIYGLIRSIHGLGGDIKVDGDAVSITLNLDDKQLQMLKEALAKPEPMMENMKVDGKSIVMMRSDCPEAGPDGKPGRFLHGNTDGQGFFGHSSDTKNMQVWMQGDNKNLQFFTQGMSCGKDCKCDCECCKTNRRMMEGMVKMGMPCGPDCKCDCKCCQERHKMMQGGACNGKCDSCKDGCKMMGKDGKGCGMMAGGGCPMMSGKDGGCKMMQGMMGKDGKGCGMMGGMMKGMPGMEGMKGMHGMMGGMMGMMPPMDMEITGKCPKCGEMMNFTVKCKMKMPPMGEMGMMGMMPPPPPDASMPDDCKDCKNK